MANKTQEVIDRAVAKIGENSSVTDSAIALMDLQSQIVRDNMEDPAALEAALNDFDVKKQALADAVARNTPAAPA